MSWLFSLQVQGHIKNLIEEHFRSDLDSAMRDPILFGDYRTALKSEPRVYEDILDYDASKALFQVHRCLDVPFIFMSLIDDFIQRSMHCILAVHFFPIHSLPGNALSKAEISISENEQAWQSEAFIILLFKQIFKFCFHSLTPIGDPGGV